MRLLLLNNNPAVSRLIKLSAEKAGYTLDEFEDYGLIPLSSYDLILVDNELYDETELSGACEQTECNYIIYICQRGAKKPEMADVALEKPFLPTDFLTLLDKVKNVLNSRHEEIEEPAPQSHYIPQVDEEKSAFDIDQIDALDEQDDLLPIDLLETPLNESVDEKGEEAFSFDTLDLDIEALDLPESSDGEAFDDEKELSVDDTLALRDELELEDEKELPSLEFEEDTDKEPLVEDFETEPLEEPLIVSPSVLDKDDINEVKQLLDESELAESDEMDAAEEDRVDVSLETFIAPLDDTDESLLDKNDEDLLDDPLPFEMPLDDLNENPLEDVSEFDFDLDETSVDAEGLALNMDDEECLEINENEEALLDGFLETADVDEKEEESETPLDEAISIPHVDVAMKILNEIEEIDSLDALNENLLKQAFGEEMSEEPIFQPIVIPEEKSEKIEVIRGEIESSISRSISGLAQSDILREALKGMRINISITFDEKE